MSGSPGPGLRRASRRPRPENAGGDAGFVQDDVGRLQRPHGAERDLIGRARPGPDQDRAAGRGGLGRLGRRHAEEPVLLARRPVAAFQRHVGEDFPEAAARREAELQRLQRLAPGLRGHRPGADLGRQQRLDPGPQRLPEDRRGAVGRDADDERRARHDRAELELAERRHVDDVDRHAGRPRGIAERLALVALESPDGEGGTGEIGRASTRGDEA